MPMMCDVETEGALLGFPSEARIGLSLPTYAGYHRNLSR